MENKFYYCQIEAESQSKCTNQCNHCKVYYYPLEQERKMEDLKDWIENKERIAYQDFINNKPS